MRLADAVTFLTVPLAAEDLKAPNRRIREGSFVTAIEVEVEGRIPRNNDPLKTGDGLHHMINGEVFRFNAKGTSKFGLIGGILTDHFEDLLVAGKAMLYGVHEWIFGLFLKGRSPAIPELRLVIDGVDYARGIAGALES